MLRKHAIAAEPGLRFPALNEITGTLANAVLDPTIGTADNVVSSPSEALKRLGHQSRALILSVYINGSLVPLRYIPLRL